MSTGKLPFYLSLCFLVAGCQPISMQSAFNPNSYPPQLGSASGAQPYGVYPGSVQSPTGKSRRTEYVWEKALQGMALGGSFGGIYGAGGGLVLGLITGLFTASAQEAQLNNQIQSEQAKDKDLEAKVEEELERQRKLENLVGSSVASNAAEPSALPSPQKATTDSVKSTNPPVNENSSPVALAALEKKLPAGSSPGAPFKNVEVKDINGDGIPDLWIYYNPLKPGEIVRQEESTHWDGKVDSWSYFKDGKLVRREVDTKGRGASDTVYYYDNDQMVREERDERGIGYATLRVLYQSGRRAKLEEDSSGSGKIDHWIYYDTSADGEVMLKEERDLNGDGVVDLWVYYKDGRLVRKDVSAAGMELLAKQDQLPASSPDTGKVALPADTKDRAQTATSKTPRVTGR